MQAVGFIDFHDYYVHAFDERIRVNMQWVLLPLVR